MRFARGFVVGLMMLFVVGASRAEAATISLFFNSGYVDTGSEGANLQATLLGLGHTVNTFVGISAAAFTAAGAGGSIIFFPEMELQNLSADLDAAAIASLQAFVSGGGTMVQANYWASNSSLPNTLFGYSLVQAGNIGATNLNAGAAAGTPFAGGPAVLPGSSAVEGVLTASLPVGARNIYSAGANTSVFMTTFGSGNYIYLGYDWFSGQVPGWTAGTASAVGTIAPAAVPEPGTLLLLGSGLAFAASRLRRRRNS